jgi:low affinity Fe/Cu permease
VSTDSGPAPDSGPGNGGLGGALANFANWFNENVVGSPWTYIFCIAAVVFTYLLIPLQGYDKWNLTSGLFFNTTSSSVELITGVGAVVGVYAVRRAQHQHAKALDKHAKSVADLHAKVDQIAAQQADGKDM